MINESEEKIYTLEEFLSGFVGTRIVSEFLKDEDLNNNVVFVTIERDGSAGILTTESQKREVIDRFGLFETSVIKKIKPFRFSITNQLDRGQTEVIVFEIDQTVD